MPRPALWIVTIGCALSFVFLFLTHKRFDRSFFIDGKVYYAAANLFAHGRDPYDGAALIAESLHADPAGYPAGTAGELYINLPAALLPAAAVSFLPWTAFTTLSLVLMAFSIPLIVVFGLTATGVDVTRGRLVGLSILLAAYPPVWRCMMTGQVAILICAVCLGVCACVERRRSPARLWGAAAFTFLALTKVTCAVPLLVYLFVRSARQERMALTAGASVFVAACLVVTVMIGPHAAVSGLRENQAITFGPAGPDYPYFAPAKFARIDLEPLLAMFVGAPRLAAVKYGLCLLLFLPLLVWTIKNGPGVDARLASAWLAFSLILFYHRSYDALMTAPILFLGIRDLVDGARVLGSVRIALFLAGYLLLGDHNIFSVLAHAGVQDQAWIRPTLFIALYASAFPWSTVPTPARSSVRPGLGKRAPREDLPKREGKEKAPAPKANLSRPSGWVND